MLSSFLSFLLLSFLPLSFRGVFLSQELEVKWRSGYYWKVSRILTFLSIGPDTEPAALYALILFNPQNEPEKA